MNIRFRSVKQGHQPYHVSAPGLALASALPGADVPSQLAEEQKRYAAERSEALCRAIAPDGEDRTSITTRILASRALAGCCIAPMAVLALIAASELNETFGGLGAVGACGLAVSLWWMALRISAVERRAIGNRRRAKCIRSADSLPLVSPDVVGAIAVATVTRGWDCAAAGREVLPGLLARVSPATWSGAPTSALRAVGRLLLLPDAAVAAAALHALACADSRVEVIAALRLARSEAPLRSIRRAANEKIGLSSERSAYGEAGDAQLEVLVSAEETMQRLERLETHTGYRSIIARCRLMERAEAIPASARGPELIATAGRALRSPFGRWNRLREVEATLRSYVFPVAACATYVIVTWNTCTGGLLPRAHSVFARDTYLSFSIATATISASLLWPLLVGLPLLRLHSAMRRERAAAARIVASAAAPDVETAAALCAAAQFGDMSATDAAGALTNQAALIPPEAWRGCTAPLADIGPLLSHPNTALSAAAFHCLDLAGERLELLPAFASACHKAASESIRLQAADRCRELERLAPVAAAPVPDARRAASEVAESLLFIQAPPPPSAFRLMLGLGLASKRFAQTDIADTVPAARAFLQRSLWRWTGKEPAYLQAEQDVDRLLSTAAQAFIGACSIGTALYIWLSTDVEHAHTVYGRLCVAALVVGIAVLAPAIVGSRFVLEACYERHRAHAARALARLRHPDAESAGALAAAAGDEHLKAKRAAEAALPRVLGIISPTEWRGASSDVLRAVGQLLTSRNLAVAEAGFNALEEVEGRIELIGAYDLARMRARTAPLRARAGARYQALRPLETSSLLRAGETPAAENLLVPAYASAAVDPLTAVRPSAAPEGVAMVEQR